MTQIFEFMMLLCFGLSWPISVYKSYTSHSTRGKSLVFMFAIVLGYLFGIAGKVAGGNVNGVLAIYCVNLTVVCTDVVLYFINRRNERRA